MLKPIRDSEIAIVGLARNCQSTLRRDIGVLTAASRHFARRRFLVVESDSSDATISVLQRLRGEQADFEFLSLGALTSDYPHRTDRIALCRNRYLDELRSNPIYAATDYVFVADLDGANQHLTASAVESCWRSEKPWDVCAANQRDVYYDVWALRHADWCPADCWSQYRRLRPIFGHEKALGIAIHSRMVRLEPRSDWIEVESAFGGLAIYRRTVLLSANYSGHTDAGEPVCEHVPLHAQLREQGARIFINPDLINARRTDHSARIRWHVRLRRRLESIGKGLRARWRDRTSLKP